MKIMYPRLLIAILYLGDFIDNQPFKKFKDV